MSERSDDSNVSVVKTNTGDLVDHRDLIDSPMPSATGPAKRRLIRCAIDLDRETNDDRDVASGFGWRSRPSVVALLGTRRR